MLKLKAIVWIGNLNKLKKSIKKIVKFFYRMIIYDHLYRKELLIVMDELNNYSYNLSM